MTETEKPKAETKQSQNLNQRISNRIKKVASVSWILFTTGLLIGFLISVSIWLREISEHAKFLANNALSILTLLVIVLQSLIYRGQRDIMADQSKAMRDSVDRTDTIIDRMQDQLVEMGIENTALRETLDIERAKTNPRLRVSKVRMENFEEGQSPIFIVTISNDGLLVARDAELRIEVKIGTDKEVDWQVPQKITIAARGNESYPIRSGALPDKKLFRDLETATLPIEVRVTLKYWPQPEGPQTFCYKYFPWPKGSKRPDDVSQFVDCGFDPRPRITARLSGVIAVTGINTAGEVEPAPSEENKDKGKNPN